MDEIHAVLNFAKRQYSHRSLVSKTFKYWRVNQKKFVHMAKVSVCESLFT